MFQRRCFQNYECLAMHAPDVGDFVRIRSIFYVPAFLWSDGFAIPATAQLTRTLKHYTRKRME